MSPLRPLGQCSLPRQVHTYVHAIHASGGSFDHLKYSCIVDYDMMIALLYIDTKIRTEAEYALSLKVV
jgi:hypothetical protein